MKQRILLLIAATACITTTQAQKSKQPVTGYAITASEKGGRGWKEVRLINTGTGEELKSIFQSKAETEALNARTGKPVAKKENTSGKQTFTATVPQVSTPLKKTVNLDQELAKANGNVYYNKVMIVRYNAEPDDRPFSTTSAAMAYDRKHERLYYTPMGINQLRYIDLNAKSPRVYYFEDEAFGVVKGMGDVANQITRMTFASDGNGYALSNDANHLIRFTTGKKPVITDLGPLSDDASNEEFSVHLNRMYGGDMIADASGNLYLVTAYHHVFKINIDSRVAKHTGIIKGLPEGFSTNGAMVEEGSKVIIASSQSTVGYYRFDLETMQAERVSGGADVFNASDLANGNLAFEKKKKDKQDEKVPEEKKETADAAKQMPATDELAGGNGISVFPNPVTNGTVRLSFVNQPAGRYEVQVVDLSGKLVASKEVNIGGERQIEELQLPSAAAKGNYIVRVTGATNKVNSSTKIVVQ